MKTAFGITAAALIATAANAQPFARLVSPPPVGKAFVYKVSNINGKSEMLYDMTSPPDGPYMASFEAAFVSQASAASPRQFTCGVFANGKVVAQASAIDIGTTLQSIGVSGQGPITVKDGMMLQADCLNSHRGAWKFAEPIKVTLVRLDSTENSTIKVHK